MGFIKRRREARARERENLRLENERYHRRAAEQMVEIDQLKKELKALELKKELKNLEAQISLCPVRRIQEALESAGIENWKQYVRWPPCPYL